MFKESHNEHIRGKSFKGRQDLVKADFSHADIRGLDFTEANLIGANFSYAKAGFQVHWITAWIISSFFISGLSGFISLVASIFATSPLGYNNIKDHTVIPGLVVLIVLLIVIVVTIHKGFIASFGVLTGAIAVIEAIVLVGIDPGAVVLVGLSVAIAGGGFLFSLAAIALTMVGSRIIGNIAWVAVGSGIVIGIVTASLAAIRFEVRYRLEDIVLVSIIAILGVYIGWQSTDGNKKFTWIQKVVIALSATGGTCFRNANLTDVDFTHAMLKSTDFRKANLTRTRFYKARRLDMARVENTILVSPAVQALLVSGNGCNKSYIGVNLRGANLIGASLQGANFKRADISEATFQKACLESANLAQTQAIGTDFRNTKMTGACLEDWNIGSTTNLEQVDCRFVYLLENPKPGTNDCERRPSSGEFAPEEFTKLFEEVLNTVDLIFRDGIDWKAFVTAFKTVQVENEGTELAIQSIENKGDGVVVVRVSVTPEANKEKIHSDFTQNYELALKAVEEKYKAELKAKDREIEIYREKSSDMKEIVGLLASRSINVTNQAKATAESKAMNESTDQSRKIEIGNVGRDFNASGQALNLGSIDISGTVTNTIDKLQESDIPEAPELAELLKQLQAAIEAEPNLSEEDKVEALEQVKALAEAGKNPQEGTVQKAAKTATKILKGTVAGLPGAAALVEACNKLLPAIASLLGLA
jgi:uncharacterized protein YjbI with pentapeptide repeats